jgi:Zn-dependent peptidase ImmA (M78 family)
VFGESRVRFFRAFGTKTKRRNLACDILGKWFVQTAKYLDSQVNFPTVDIPQYVPSSPDGRYTDEEIEEAADNCRAAWGLGTGPLSSVIGLLESKGVIVCRYRVTHDAVEAFSFWNGSRPFVFLASIKGSACRARYDAAHELAHLALHRWIGQEELDDTEALALIEREANRFAGALLAPRESFPTEIYTTRLDAFLPLKLRWKISIKAMVYRCKNLGLFDEDQATNLYKQISARKWNQVEAYDDPETIPLEQPKVLQRAAQLLLQRGVRTVDAISAELPLDRSEIEQFWNLPAGTLAPKQPTITEFRATLKANKAK